MNYTGTDWEFDVSGKPNADTKILTVGIKNTLYDLSRIEFVHSSMRIGFTIFVCPGRPSIYKGLCISPQHGCEDSVLLGRTDGTMPRTVLQRVEGSDGLIRVGIAERDVSFSRKFEIRVDLCCPDGARYTEETRASQLA